MTEKKKFHRRKRDMQIDNEKKQKKFLNNE